MDRASPRSPLSGKAVEVEKLGVDGGSGGAAGRRKASSPVGSPRSPEVEKIMKRLSAAHKQGKREWDARASPNETEIPEYIAEKDAFCTYTKTKSFRESPYYRLKLFKKNRGSSGEEDIDDASIDFGDLALGMDFDLDLQWDEQNADPTNSLDTSALRLQNYYESTSLASGAAAAHSGTLIPRHKTKKRPRELMADGDGLARVGSAAGIRELHTMKLIFLREGLVDALLKKFRRARSRIRAGVSTGNWDRVAIEAHMHAAATAIAPVLDALRVRTIHVIESVAAWRNTIRGEGQTLEPSGEESLPREFLWQGFNYLLKVTVDAAFMGRPLTGDLEDASLLRTLGLASVRNPLFTTVNLEELALRAEPAVTSAAAPTGLQFPASLASESSLGGRPQQVPGPDAPDDPASVSEARLARAAAILLQEEAAFGRVAPLEYNTCKDLARTSDGLLPQFQRQRSRDDLDCGRDQKANAGAQAGAHRHTLAPRAETLWRTDSLQHKRPRSARGRPRIDDGLSSDTGFLALRVHHIVQLRHQPSELAQGVLGAVRVLLLNPREPIPPQTEFSWVRLADQLLTNELRLMQSLATFEAASCVTVSKAKFLQPIFTDERFNPALIRQHSEPAALLCTWCLVSAAKYVLRPELCFDYNEHVRTGKEHEEVGSAIAALQRELRDLRNSIASGALLPTSPHSAGPLLDAAWAEARAPVGRPGTGGPGSAARQARRSPSEAPPCIVIEGDGIVVRQRVDNPEDVLVLRAAGGDADPTCLQDEELLLSTPVFERRAGLSFAQIARNGNAEERSRVIAAAAAALRAGPSASNSLWRGAVFDAASRRPLLARAFSSRTPRGVALSARSLSGLQQEDIFLNQAQVQSLASIDLAMRPHRTGLTDWRHTESLCSLFARRIRLGKAALAAIEFDTCVQVDHPEYGFDISGALVRVQAHVHQDGNVLVEAAVLRSGQTARSIGPGHAHQLQAHLTAQQLAVLGWPALPDLIQFLRVEKDASAAGGLRLSLQPRLLLQEGIYLGGHLADVCVELQPLGATVSATLRAGGPDGEVHVTRSVAPSEVDNYLAQTDLQNAGTPHRDFSGLVDSLLLLPWPESASGFRLEFADWKEQTLPVNVVVDGERVGTVSLGSRSSLYDARRQIKRAKLPGVHRFLFQACRHRDQEVAFLVFDVAYPDIVLRLVEEYSDDEEEDDEDDGQLEEDGDEEALAGDQRLPAGQAKGKQKGPKSRKRRRKKKNKQQSMIDMLMKGGTRGGTEAEAAAQAERERIEQEAAEAIRKRKEEEERKRRDMVFFEELVELPGHVSAASGDTEVHPSVDWMDDVRRGDTLEIGGVRCVVAKNKARDFDPGTVPLRDPFGTQRAARRIANSEEIVGPADDDDQAERHQEREQSLPDGDRETEQALEEPIPPLPSAAPPDDADEVDEALSEPEVEGAPAAPVFLENVVAFKIVKLPAKAQEMKGVTVSVQQGSTYLATSNDIRYRVKLGALVRIGEQHVVKLTTRLEDPFEECGLSLDEPYRGESGEGLRFDLVEILDEDAKAKQKSILQKERERQEARMRALRLEEELKQNEKFFGYTVSWRVLVPLLGKGKFHMQQQDFRPLVTLEQAVDAIYRMVCKDWFPAGEGLDNVKWVKLLKQLPGINKDHVTSTEMDLIFAKSTAKGERRLTRREFSNVALPQIALKQYPWLDEDDAMDKFRAEVLGKWEETQRLMWTEAKRLAVREEGRRHCAAVKAQTFLRGACARRLFKAKQRATRILQKQLRSHKDRCEFLDLVASVRRAREAHLAEVDSIRRARRTARLYSHVRLIGGVANIVTVMRHTQGAVAVSCYDPRDSTLYRFTVSRDNVRTIIEESTSKADLSDDELYKPKFLEYLLQRLQYRKRVGQNAIVIGRKPNTEAGTKLLVQAVYVPRTDKSKVLKLVTITEARGEFTFHAYDPSTCGIKSVNLERHQLHRWLDFDESTDSTPPELLRAENQQDLLQWMVQRLMLCSACALSSHYAIHRRGDDVLMLECHKAEHREGNMATKLQGMWRRRQSRRTVQTLISRAYRKQWDPNTNRWYYVRYDTGEVTWERPRLLGSLDLPDPPDVWERSFDSDGNVYYYHALTGRTSWLSETDAAVLVQRLFRKRQAKEFRVTLPELVKALSFQRQSEINFEKNPDRLSSLANYALLVHTRDHNHTMAKKLYARALEMAPNSPLLLFSSAVFELANNTYPRKKTFELAIQRVDQARRIDPKLEKFQAAQKAFFFFAVLSQPGNAYTWLNYALVHQCVVRDFEAAEKYYRKALDLDPGNKAVLDNYTDFMENRLPGGRYSGGGPGAVAFKRSSIESQDGEWAYMRDPDAAKEAFALFWGNLVTQKTQWEEPNWALEWIARRKRSQLSKKHDGWSQYLDPVNQAYFYCHLESGESTWVCPPYLANTFGVLDHLM